MQKSLASHYIQHRVSIQELLDVVWKWKNKGKVWDTFFTLIDPEHSPGRISVIN